MTIKKRLWLCLGTIYGQGITQNSSEIMDKLLCKKGGLDSTNPKDAMDNFFYQMDPSCLPIKGV